MLSSLALRGRLFASCLCFKGHLVFEGKMELKQVIREYELAYGSLRQRVRQDFPVGSLVRVGNNPSVATVVGYSEHSPECVDVQFENGNIWSKNVAFLSLEGQ